MIRTEPRLGHSLLLLLLLALGLRLPQIDSGLWFDEIRLLTEFCRLDLMTVLTTYGSDNNHPLYTLFAWLSLRIFGESAGALRLPALVFGLLSLVAIARLAGLFLGAKRGLFVSLLAAVSYHHVWFSDNARGYTMLLFFTVAATYELICLLDDIGHERLLSYAITMACATWVHATGVFVALAHLAVVWFMSGRARPRGMLGIILAGLLSLVMHAPIVGEMFDFLLGESGHARVSSDWTNPLWAVQEALRTFGIPSWAAVAVGLVGAGFLVLALRRLAAIDKRLPWLFLLPAVFGTAGMIVLERNLWPRFYFNLLGFLLIIGVVGLEDLSTRLKIGARARAAGGILLVAAFLIILPPALTLPKQDYASAALFADAREQEGATIVTLGLAQLPYERYYVRAWEKVDEAARLTELIDSSTPVFAMHTLPTFLESRHPELAQVLADRGKEVARYRGSIGGGDVVVYLLR